MRCAAGAVVLTLLVAGCSSGDDGGGDAAPATTTVAPATSTTTPPEPEPAAFEADVAALADDAMAGRDNGTPGSDRAQAYLVEQLQAFAEPLGEDFRVPFASGVNVVGVIPGADRAAEFVVLGAHYDHLGSACRTVTPGDAICNGAGDNAAGVAAVLEIGRRLAEGDPPDRTVVLAFWDAEEDGLLGSAAYTSAPPVPLESTVAYLNWDIQGVVLLPSLASTTIVVGAETGGPALVEAVRAATAAAPGLDPVLLSLLFGQGRSDHAVFAAAGVPVAFFTDSTSGCYHTNADDLSAVDLGKLGHQVDLGEAVARELASTGTPPAFAAGTPVATYDDARAMADIVRRAQPDLGRFDAGDQAVADQYRADLDAIVAAGPDAFDDADVGVLLGGAAAVVDLLATSACDAGPG